MTYEQQDEDKTSVNQTVKFPFENSTAAFDHRSKSQFH
jgi:hypothetical protein